MGRAAVHSYHLDVYPAQLILFLNAKFEWTVLFLAYWYADIFVIVLLKKDLEIRMRYLM